MEALCAYHWPGNVRELENVVERAIVSAKNTILVDHLPGNVIPDKGRYVRNLKSAGISLKEAEKRSYKKILQMTHGSKKEAAKYWVYRIERLNIK